MMEQEINRIKVSTLLDVGLPQMEVARVAKVGVHPVQCMATAKRSGKGHERKPRSGTHPCVSDKTFIETLLSRIMENHQTLLRQHSREMGLSLDTIRRSVAELGFKSFVWGKH